MAKFKPYIKDQLMLFPSSIAEAVDKEEDALYGDKRGDELPEDINSEEKLKKKLDQVIKRFKSPKEKNQPNRP